MRRAAALLLAALPAWPASALEDDAFAYLREEAVVVAAAKREQDARTAPAASHVVDAATIRRMGWRTISELLASLPGFYATTDRNYGYLWVRGLGRPTDYNMRVLILVDGHRLNENLFGSFFIGRDFSLDLMDAERVEVVKGPGAALYGDNAMFAVVNIVTRRPQEGLEHEGLAEGGSRGLARAWSAVRAKRGERELALSGSYSREDGEALEFAEFPGKGPLSGADREESYTGYASARSGPLSLRGNLSNRRKRVPTGSFLQRGGDHNSFTSDQRSFIEGELAGQVAEDFHGTLRLYQDWYGYYGNYIYDAAAPPPDALVNKDEARAAWRGGEARLRHDGWGADNATLLGLEFEGNERGLLHNHDEEPFAEQLNQDIRTHRWALYGQQESAPAEGLKLSAGLRWDRYSAFGHAWSPRAAAAWAHDADGVLRAAAGGAFRAPTPYERFYATTAGGSEPNKDLRPERLQTYELSYARRFGADEAGLSVFHNRIEGLIDQRTQASGLNMFVNAFEARTWGAEFLVRRRLAHGLTGRVAYILQETRAVGGDRLSNSPLHAADLRVEWDPTRSLVLNAQAHILGTRRATRGTDLPAEAALDLGASWTVATGTTLFASARNVLDAGLRASGGNEHRMHAIPQGGRTLAAGVRWGLGGATSRR